MGPSILKRVQGYLLPCVFIIASTACESLVTNQYLSNPALRIHFLFLQTTHLLWHEDLFQAAITAPGLLFSGFQACRHRAFAKLWMAVGKDFAEDVPPTFDAILQASRGIILDVGPGAGHQVFRFSHPENITAIYGVEPGVDMHAKLRELAEEAGLEKKYEILACGAEPESLLPALAREGLLGKEQSVVDGIFDEIVCIRVLCGVPKLN